MLIVVSPAKSLDFSQKIATAESSKPDYTRQAKLLIKELKTFSADELMKLMSISDNLAVLNVQRFKKWKASPKGEEAAQAIAAFKGEVYTGMDVSDWAESDFEFAQEHLRILSGLYGVLRPLDLIAAYRLEMGTKLDNPEGANLYKFWGDTIVKNINKQLKKQGDDILINLASNEYFKSVNKKLLKGTIITPVFKDAKNGEYKVLSFFAKKARGMMSRYIIKNRLENPDQLKLFTDGGYSFNERLTEGNNWVFTRD